MLASKSTQINQEIYRLIGQFAVMAAAISKTEMTPSGHVFPDRVSCSTQLSLKFILLINVKVPTIDGILTSMSMINDLLL